MAILKTEKKQSGEIIIENLFHDSTSMLKTSYNFTTNQLYVTFVRGSVFGYTIPLNIYEAFKSADSQGVYLNAVIKKEYTASKIGDVPKELLTEIVNKLTTFKNPEV